MLIGIVLEVVVLALLIWIWLGRRPTVERFATAHGVVVDAASIHPVRAQLARTYTGRVVGALVGALLLGLLALLIGVGAAIGASLIGLIAGTMVGIAIAQHRRGPAPGAVRHASLEARSIGDYAPAHSGWWVALTAAVCVLTIVAVPVAAPAGLGPYAAAVALAAVTVLIIPLGAWLMRRIVEAPRDDTAPAVDDALRGAAVRALYHSVLGVLLCGLIVAGVGGLLTQQTLVVTTDHGTVFTAPPGSTSLGVGSGLHQPGDPNPPVLVTWIEADGSEHETVLRNVDGAPTTGTADGSGAIPFWWLTLIGIIATLVQWARATNAWRRGPRRPAAARATTTGTVGTIA
jgi:hypothetical protein